MAVFFLLLLLVVQIGFLLASRSMAISAAEASARRAAAGSPPDHEEDRLADEFRRAIPGADVRSIEVTVSATSATVAAVIDWRPPGPVFVPVVFDLTTTRAVAIPP